MAKGCISHVASNNQVYFDLCNLLQLITKKSSRLLVCGDFNGLLLFNCALNIKDEVSKMKEL